MGWVRIGDQRWEDWSNTQYEPGSQRSQGSKRALIFLGKVSKGWNLCDIAIQTVPESQVPISLLWEKSFNSWVPFYTVLKSRESAYFHCGPPEFRSKPLIPNLRRINIDTIPYPPDCVVQTDPCQQFHKASQPRDPRARCLHHHLGAQLLPSVLRRRSALGFVTEQYPQEEPKGSMTQKYELTESSSHTLLRVWVKTGYPNAIGWLVQEID